MALSFAIISDPVEITMGGIENHASILYALLSNRGYKVSLIAYKSISPRAIGNSNVVVIEGIRRAELLKMLFMKKRNTMLLFTHGSFYLHSSERKELRKYDSTGNLPFKFIFDKIFMSLILNKFDKIITLSEAESRDISALFGIKPDRMSDLEVFSDELDEQYPFENIGPKFRYQEFLCYVGRLDYRKNLLSLLEASRRLDIPLLVAGQDQGILAELEVYCKVKNFKKLFYLGKISKEEKIALLRSSLLIVIPSFFEGIPAAAIEAIKLGKKIVMTSNSYMADHPCIFKSRPDPDSLVMAIRAALASKECTVGYTSNGEIFEKFLKIVDTVNHN